MLEHSVRGVLHATPPFDFAKSLAFVCSFPPTAGEQDVGAGTLTKAIIVRGRPILFELTATRDATTLAYALHAMAPVDDVTRDTALRRIRFQLSLDDDLAPFHALARDDASFAPVLRRQHGLHHPKFPSAFEIAVWSVLTQRMPIAAARKVKRALVEKLGAQIGEHRAFPEASTLAAAREDEVAAIVRHTRKAAALVAIANAFASVDADAYLATAPFDEAEAWLRALPLLGPWSTAFILFRGLGRMPRLAIEGGPIADAARRAYGAISDREVLAISERYGEWCGYWALYLRAGSSESAQRAERASTRRTASPAPSSAPAGGGR